MNTNSVMPKYFYIFFFIYCGASLAHFVHNAEFLADYPNLPEWLTRSRVYLAWFSVTAVGVVGLLLLKFGLRLPGLVVVIVYALLGFAGLDHYWVAPVSAHTLGMNATIWFEVAAASALLLATLGIIFTPVEAKS